MTDLQIIFLAASLTLGAAGIKEAVTMDTAKDMQDQCITSQTREEHAGAHNWLIDHGYDGCDV